MFVYPCIVAVNTIHSAIVCELLHSCVYRYCSGGKFWVCGRFIAHK